MNELRDMRDVRDRVILAALAHVPFEGWSERALREGAKDAGFDETIAERAFPSGTVAAVEHFCDLADRRLMEEAQSVDLQAMGMTDRMAWLVRRRIEAWAEHREAVRRAVTFLSLPTHAPASLRITWRTVDALWYAAGDKSADFSFYTRRATLAAIYTATLLYWLEDASDEFADSWNFLRRRLANVARLPKLREEARRRLSALPNPMHLLTGKPGARRHFGVGRG